MSIKFSCSVLACLVLSSLSLRAQLVFPTTEVDVKASVIDTQSTALFKFTNESDKTVVITNLKSSCGCTVPQLDKREYAPGESGEIKAIFNFGNRRGVQRKRITVSTTGDTYNLLFTTHIPDWASIEPRILRWSIQDPLSPKEVRLRIELPGQIELLPPNLDLEHFTIMDTKVGENEWVYRVIPKDTSERVTERVAIKLHASGVESNSTREIGFHCLIR